MNLVSAQVLALIMVIPVSLQQNSETVLADMVNNLMSGLLGQPGSQPSSSASSAAASGTSTTSTATPAGTAQPGATSTQPGLPRANIRIENPGLTGFFPGRMPHIPGLYAHGICSEQPNTFIYSVQVKRSIEDD